MTPTFEPTDHPATIATAIRAGAPYAVLGDRFYPLPVQPEHVDTEVILNALSRIQRYNGQLLSIENPAGWTVAQHTLALAWWASEIETPTVVRELLVHDWEEAWTGDIGAGVKRAGLRPALQPITAQITEAIRTRLQLPGWWGDTRITVNAMDIVIVSAELALCGPSRLQAVANQVHGLPGAIVLEQVQRARSLNERDTVSALAQLCQQHEIWVTNG